MNIFKRSLPMFVLFAAAPLAFAQISLPPAGALDTDDGYTGYGDVFSVNGVINSIDGTQGLVSADFRIDFIGSEINFINTMVVTVVNTSTADSLLAGFYLTKPLGLSPTLDNSNSTPDDWKNDSSLAGDFSNFVNNNFSLTTKQEKDDFSNSYFGAYFGTRLPDGTYDLSGGLDNNITADEVGQFSFEFDSPFSLSNWQASYADKPMLFARWQEINYSDDIYDFSGDSGKGYGGPGFETTVIPEPSEVALMAMLGLGGLLYARRRFMKK